MGIKEEAYIDAIRDKYSYSREIAAKRLGESGYPGAVEPLISLVTNRDEKIELRSIARTSLGKLGNLKAVESLIPLLRDREVGSAACYALGELGDRRAVEPLIELLREGDSRVAACIALGKLGDRRAVEPLIPLLSRNEYKKYWGRTVEYTTFEEADLRSAACFSLGCLGDTLAVEPLITVLSEKKSHIGKDVRKDAAFALANLGDSRALNPLITLLRDKEVGYVVCLALGKLGDRRAVEPLIEVLRNGEEELKGWACEALGELGDHRAFEPMVSLLWENNHESSVAARSLGRFGDPRAVEPLICALREGDTRVREGSCQALGMLGNTQAADFLSAALNDTDGKVRYYATLALARLGDSRAIDPIISDLLKKKYSRGYENKIVRALRKFVKLEMVEPLIEIMRVYEREDEYEEDGPGLTRQVIRHLGDLQDPRAVVPLLISQKYKCVNQNVQDAILRICEKHGLSPLVEAIQHPDNHVRDTAFYHLEKLFPTWRESEITISKIPDLLQDLINPDSKIRIRTEETLERIKSDWHKTEIAKQLVPKFVDGLFTNKLDVQIASATILGKIEDGRSIIPLIRVMERNQSGLSKPLKEALGKIYDSDQQKNFRDNFPYLLCSGCLLRPKQIKVKSGLFNRLTFVVCRGCKIPINLIPSIKKVIGLIGGELSDFKVAGEDLYANIWSEKKKKSRNADISLLEIRNSSAITYDYAINSVLATLKDDSSRPRDFVRSIPVIIYNHPPIAEDSMKILECEFGRINYEP